MLRFKIFSYRFITLLGTFLILSQNSALSGQDGESLEDRSELKATVSVSVSWDKHDEYNGNLENSGSMSSSISGVLVKSQGRRGIFMFVPEDSGMNAVVQYQNVRSYKKTGETYMREEGSGSVQVMAPQYIGDPQSQGHMELMAMTGPGGIAHALQMGGEVDPFAVMGMMKSDVNMDHYSFSVATPIKTIVTDDEGKTHEGLRGIHFALIAEALEQGTISNSLKWTSEKVKYSIRHQSFLDTKYDPPKSGDVEYSVSWTFGDIPPYAEIQREVNGEWKNITDETEKVVVGEKIKLRGVVLPKNQDSGTGEWTLEGGGSGKNYIKKYKADIYKGEVIPLTDLNTKELEFYWVDGGSASVKYVVNAGDNEASAESKFEIRKPAYKVTINASPDSRVGKPERGEPLPQGECMGTGAHGAAKPDDIWLQYNGIRFEAENLDRGETPGSEQWVQIIENQHYFQTWQGGVRQEEYLTDALDICYPSWDGPRGGDAPAILLMRDQKQLTNKLSDGTIAPMMHTGKTQENRVYLMFRPDGDDSEWVPVKVFNWTWVGHAEYQSRDDDKEKGTTGWSPWLCKVIPEKPEAEDTSQYPVWNKNAGDPKQYSDKKP